jgi:rsbT antagonist protein RsbS
VSDLRGTIPILRLGDILISTVHVDLHDAVAEAFQADVLTAIERTGAKGLVIDVSGLELVDSYVARIVSDTGRMAKLMGTQMVLVGMRPEVAATLVRMGYSMEGVKTALNLDEGLVVLRKAGH